MEGEIVNRVANSKLITIDLEDYYPKGERYELDIAGWLYEGLVLREKEFRAHVQEHDWETYKGGFLHIHCSSDAIIPAWAYMLCTSKAGDFTESVVIGSREDLETVLYTNVISEMDTEPFRDKPIIIKGCTNKPVPKNAYTMLTQKLIPVAKSIMYGEACSSVPLFKRK